MNKINELKTRLAPPDCPDLIFICETWFKPDSPLAIEGYTLFHLSRECAKGGVAIYASNNLITYQISNKEIDITGSEQIWCGITIGNERLLAGCIYRPPSSSETVNKIINNSIKRAKSLVDQGKFSRLLIVGDFNRHISWTSAGGLASLSDDILFLENINSNFLTQFVLEPTLGKNQLDLVLSDDPGSIFHVEVGAPLGCSDKNNYHATLRWKFFVKDKQVSQINPVRHDFKRGDYVELANYLRNISWSNDLESLSVDEAYDKILCHYNLATRNFIPTRQFSRKENPTPKWFSQEINAATKEKYSAFARLRAASSSIKNLLKPAYNKSARKVKKLIAEAIKNYEMSIISKCKSNPKLLYCHINRQKKCKIQIRALEDLTGKLTSNGVEMANILNQQFFSVFSVDSPGEKPLLEQLTAAKSQFGAEIFSSTAIENCLASLDKHKPPGIDGLHSFVLVEARKELALPLSLLFSQSFNSAQVPSSWKQANITPIFKKDSKVIASNYRPISLTSIPCKIMERLIRNAMIKHLVDNNLLNPNQHGFSPGKSCATNLLETLDIITDAMESRFDVVLVLLDFAKAFDKVSHSLLLVKLKAYGFDQKICLWIEAFLSHRKQRVVLGEHLSEWLDVLSGVPQGSVLGPLLFLIFINDMPSLVGHFCKLFADDTKLIAVIKDNLDYATLQSDIDKLVDWSKLWRMSFNEDKCKAMFIDKRRHNLLNMAFLEDAPGTHIKLTMCDEQGKEHVLEEVSTERDLGILINNKLKWHNQVAYAKNKAYATIGLLKRTFKFWTPESLRILYCTYVRPHLEYCSAAWGPYSTEDINALESVQRRATKLVPQLKPLKYDERLSALGIQSLATRRRRGDLIQYFKIYHGINKVNWINPIKLAPALSTAGPASGLRGSHLRIARQKVINCAPREHFLTNRIVDDWNNLPIDVVNARSTNAFKNKLDKFNKTRPLHCTQ